MENNVIDKETEEAKKKALHFGVQFVALRGMDIPYGVLSVIPENLARRNQLIVYKKDGKHIDIAIADPDQLQQKAPQILTDLKKKEGYSFNIGITTPTDFNYALLGYKQKQESSEKKKIAPTTSERSDGEQGNKTPPQVKQGTSVIESVDLKGKEIPYETLIKFPQNIAKKYKIIIFEEDDEGKKVKVAVEDPNNLQTQEILDFISSRNDIDIKQYKTKSEDIDWALALYDRKPKDLEKDSNIAKDSEDPRDLMKDSGGVKRDFKEREEDGKKEQAEVVSQKPERKELKKEDITFSEVKKPSTESSQDIQNKKDQDTLNQDKKIPSILAKKIADKKIDQESEGSGKPKYKEETSDDEESKEVNNIEVGSISGDGIKSISEKDAMTITASSEEEQNLDKLLPNGVEDIKELAQIVSSGSIPKIVAAILYLATKFEASDVHIEADAKNLHLRYRIDGVLKDVLKMPISLQAPIVSRIKILTKLKIDEQRIPQDGRFDVIVINKEIDLRVSTLPTVHGEKVVMRLLDKTTGIIDLEKLGLIGINLKRVQVSIQKPYGIIFVTGPTGSGKTTTLYAILNKLNTPEVNIITLEDPVEYELSGINQCQVKPKIGFGFANGLRSILRQDPNIIMVGEVRDTETANMTTHAALTGHLVLSTLHTNDSCGALPRLIDMGVEPYLITSSINAIIAQRLVRKLCDKCKEETKLPDKLKKQIQDELVRSHDEEIKKLASGEMKFYRPKGCSACKDGYKGRIGLFEVLSMTGRIEQLAVNRATSSIIKRAALNQGLITIRQDGFAKAVKGITSVDEIIRTTSK